MTLLAILMVVVLMLAVLLVIPRAATKSRPPSHATSEAGIEEEELARAEEELSELDALATPEDAADAIPDWGPGAPKYKRDTRDPHR